jgi:hypothetical protein
VYIRDGTANMHTHTSHLIVDLMWKLRSHVKKLEYVTYLCVLLQIHYPFYTNYNCKNTRSFSTSVRNPNYILSGSLLLM